MYIYIHSHHIWTAPSMTVWMAFLLHESPKKVCWGELIRLESLTVHFPLRIIIPCYQWHTQICIIYVYIYICVYIYMYIYMCVYIYVYIWYIYDTIYIYNHIYIYIHMLQCLVAPPPRYVFGTAPLFRHISFQERCLTAYVQELLSLDRARWEKKSTPDVNLTNFCGKFSGFLIFEGVKCWGAKTCRVFFRFCYKMWMMKDDVVLDHLFVVIWAKYSLRRREAKPRKCSLS